MFGVCVYVRVFCVVCDILLCVSCVCVYCGVYICGVCVFGILVCVCVFSVLCVIECENFVIFV